MSSFYHKVDGIDSINSLFFQTPNKTKILYVWIKRGVDAYFFLKKKQKLK